MSLSSADSTATEMPPAVAVGPREITRALDRGRAPSIVLYVVVPLVIAGLMLAYLLNSRRVTGEFGFPLDDSWIHVRFAQNLARGYGFSFNPGQPTSSTTGPLWTLLMGLAYRITGEYLFTSAILNWLFCCLIALTAAALARTLIPSRTFGAVTALVVALTVPLPWLALSGMEPPMFMWLTLLGLLLHVRLRRARGLRSIVPTVVFGLAVISRPEGFLLFPLAMLDRLLVAQEETRGWPGLKSWLRQLAIHTPIFAAIVAPLISYNLLVIGRPLPSSYYVKAYNFGLTGALALKNNELVFQSLVEAPLKTVGALLLLWAGNNFALIIPFLLGFYLLVKRDSPMRSADHRSYLIPLLLVVQPVAWAISTNYHRPPWFQGQRYFANLGPLYMLVGLVGLWWWLERPRPERIKFTPAWALALVLLAALARQPDQAALFAHNVKNITDMQVTTARWIKQHLPKNSLLAMNDVGAIAAITDMRVLDMIGLVSPEITQHFTKKNSLSGAWRLIIWEEAQKQNVDYLVIVMKPERYEGYLRSGHRPIHYISIDDNITCGGPLIVVFEPWWRPTQAAAQSNAPGAR